jgi:hypothetical protein
VLHCGITNTALPEWGSIEAARLPWTAQRQDNNAGRRDAVNEIIVSGVTTLGDIAKALQARGILTPSGTTKWHRAQVARLIERQPIEATPSTPAPADSPSETGEDSNGRLNVDAPPFEAVAIEVTADHLFLPTGEDGDVGPSWETAPETERVRQGRRLRVPRAMADCLIDRRQARMLRLDESIPAYFRPGTPGRR